MNTQSEFDKNSIERFHVTSHPALRLYHFPFMPMKLDWYVIQRSQKQELLGTYAFSVLTIT